MAKFIELLQAEDGIRVVAVTGVQTCALPISSRAGGHRPGKRDLRPASSGRGLAGALFPRQPARGVRRQTQTGRSEERRVGKECRSRWSPYHLKKKRLDGY